MLAKSIKFAMVFAVILTFFGGTAMAGNRGRNDHRMHKADKWDRHYGKHHYKNRHHVEYTRRVNRPRAPHHPTYHRVSKPHPLAPRIVFLGGLPVPVPPPPHEVFAFITGHR